MVNWSSFSSFFATTSTILTIILLNLTSFEATDPVYIKDCSYSASNTASATQNYETCVLEACYGETVIFDGCSCSFDTYFRLYDSNSMMLTYSDDSCGVCSKVQYTLYSSGCQTLTLRMGCYSAGSCSATVAVYKIFTADSPTPFPTISSPPTRLPTISPSSFPGSPPTPAPTAIEYIVPISFAGDYSDLNTVVATNDVVSFSAIYSPFSVYSMDFSAYSVYSYTLILLEEGTYPYTITDSISRSGSGIISVQTPTIFNSNMYSYYLNPGDFMRWQLNGGTPSYPTYFYGPDNSPGISRLGSNYYDYIFALPGSYDWAYWTGWGYFSYRFNVYDPVTDNHYNLKWGGDSMPPYASFYENTKLVFYFIDNHKQNIRITNSKGGVVWVSQDLNLPGDSASVTLPGGVYTATSDYDPLITMTIQIYTYHNDKKNKQLIPKSLIRAAELTFVVFGVVGLTDLIVDTITANAPKPPKFPNLPKPIGIIGDHISIHAMDVAKERESSQSK